MGRDRAQNDPFWATSLPRMQGSVAEIVTRLDAVIRRSPLLAPHCWMGSGWRPGGTEHPTGRAIDIMITATTNRRPTDDELRAGNLLVEWLIEHADELGVQGIIFSRDGKDRPQFWGYSKGRHWRNGSGRGSISGDHVDHVHVLFRSDASWAPKLTNAVIGGPPPTIVKPATFKKGILDMTQYLHRRYGKDQIIGKGEKYLYANPGVPGDGPWWWLHSAPGLTAVSISGYATAGNDCQIFICAENDVTKGARIIGRALLPNGRGSFSGSALATLREGEVVRLRAANNSGKSITIHNVSTAIAYED